MVLVCAMTQHHDLLKVGAGHAQEVTAVWPRQRADSWAMHHVFATFKGCCLDRSVMPSWTVQQDVRPSTD